MTTLRFPPVPRRLTGLKTALLLLGLAAAGCGQGTDISGHWASATCEPGGPMTFLKRDFVLTQSTWQLDLSVYGDAACTNESFTDQIAGPYTLGNPSSVIPGATEAVFVIKSDVWTAKSAMFATTLTQAGCGAQPWQVGVSQDVTQTGCLGISQKVSDCPQEYDVVKVDGNNLYFGNRTMSICKVQDRPTSLGSPPLVRQ